MTKESKTIFRAYAPSGTTRLVKVIAEIKEVNLSEILTEALHDWLNRSDNQALIQKHNLSQN